MRFGLICGLICGNDMDFVKYMLTKGSKREFKVLICVCR